MIVLDSSLTLSWFFQDEHTFPILALLNQVERHGAIVPPLWRIEVANGLQTAIRRGRIDAAYRDAALEDLRALPISSDAEGERYAWSSTLRLAERFKLTLYDATFLELAQRQGLSLATLDEALRAAARSCSIPLLGMASDPQT